MIQWFQDIFLKDQHVPCLVAGLSSSLHKVPGMGMPSKMHRIDGGRVSKGMIVSTQRVPESFLCALDPLLLVNPLPNHIFLPDFFPFLLSTENINGVGITDRVAKNSFFQFGGLQIILGLHAGFLVPSSIEVFSGYSTCKGLPGLSQPPLPTFLFSV